MSIMRKEDFIGKNEHAVRALEIVEKLPRRNVVIDPNVVKQLELEDQRNQYLLTLGIDVYTTDGDEELDLDRIEALMHVLRGEPVPKELERKLLEKERLRRERLQKLREDADKRRKR